jgi:zinc transporter 1/2/3
VAALFIALCFHQCFEGIALGASIVDAKIKRGIHLTIMVSIFILTTPIGIMIGILISSNYDPESNDSLVLLGVFDSLSSGVLIYMALVDLIADDFHK